MSSAFDLNALMSNLSLLDGNEINVAHAVNANWKLLPELTAKLNGEVSKFGKNDLSSSIAACNVFIALANNAMTASEPFLCSSLPVLFKAAGSKQNALKKSASDAVLAIVDKTSPNAVREILRYCFAAAKIEENWNTRCLALRVIAHFGDRAPIQLAHDLLRVVPEVTSCMIDPKKEVKEAARAAMSAACDVIGNRDIEHMTSQILCSIANPGKVSEIIQSLASVTFVQSVQSPALAMVVPLLLSGLASNVASTRTQAAVIIENMSKLVEDPLDVAPFLPELMPALARSAEFLFDPEARAASERAYTQLNRLHDVINHLHTQGIQFNDVFAVLNTNAPSAPPAGAEFALPHIASMICSLMGMKQFNLESWSHVIAQLTVITNADAANATVHAIIPICKEMVQVSCPPQNSSTVHHPGDPSLDQHLQIPSLQASDETGSNLRQFPNLFRGLGEQAANNYIKVLKENSLYCETDLITILSTIAKVDNENSLKTTLVQEFKFAPLQAIFLAKRILLSVSRIPVITNMGSSSPHQSSSSVELTSGPFSNLLHGFDPNDVDCYLKVFTRNRITNENSLKTSLVDLSGNDINEIVSHLQTLSLNKFQATFLAKRILLSAVYVPDIYRFTRSVIECACPPHNTKPNDFIGVDKTLNEALVKIKHHLNMSSDRTPPLMISRMSRGGKTTLLYLLFERLKSEGYHPIYISFNGTYTRLEGLSESESILHLITVQLTNPNEINGRKIICNENALDRHLGNEPVVLLIDELNVLSHPIDEDASCMLKRLFLDKMNRYLVFSTHVPMPIDPKVSNIMVSLSARQCIPVSFEPIADPAELQKMGVEYQNLSPMEAVVYGGIPSLIYSHKDLCFNPVQHFNDNSKHLTFDEKHFEYLLLSVITGELSDEIEDYARFGMLSLLDSGEIHVHWPLCYIVSLLKSFACTSALKEQLKTVFLGISSDYSQLLSCSSRNKGSGKDWESLINIVILLRCVLSKYQQEYFPFFNVNKPTSTVIFHEISENNIHQTQIDIAARITQIPHDQFPVVLFAVPTVTDFPIVDGILAYCAHYQSNIEYHGYQAKAGEGYPKESASEIPEWMKTCYLLRGNAPTTIRGTDKPKWTYLNQSTIVKLLGSSLAHLYPAFLH